MELNAIYALKSQHNKLQKNASKKDGGSTYDIHKSVGLLCMGAVVTQKLNQLQLKQEDLEQ